MRSFIYHCQSCFLFNQLPTPQVSHLKQQVIQHVTSGCDLSLTPLLNQHQSPPPSASSSSSSPTSPVRHVVVVPQAAPPPHPPSSMDPGSSRHRLPPSPPRSNHYHHQHHHPKTPTSPQAPLPPAPPPPTRPTSLIVTSSPPLPPMKYSPLPPRDAESPEVEDVCLNLTVSSRRSPDDVDESLGLKIEEMEENGNHIKIRNS